MHPSISAITLGVNDFSQSLLFYKKGLGWQTKATRKDDVAFFKLNGVVLALYDKKALAKDAGVNYRGNGFPGITLAHNARSEKEVNEIFKKLARLRARVVKKPQKTSWGGYGGYFADPDGYLWEVVYNPHWKMDPKGSIIKV